MFCVCWWRTSSGKRRRNCLLSWLSQWGRCRLTWSKLCCGRCLRRNVRSCFHNDHGQVFCIFDFFRNIKQEVEAREVSQSVRINEERIPKPSGNHHRYPKPPTASSNSLVSKEDSSKKTLQVELFTATNCTTRHHVRRLQPRMIEEVCLSNRKGVLNV